MAFRCEITTRVFVRLFVFFFHVNKALIERIAFLLGSSSVFLLFFPIIRINYRRRSKRDRVQRNPPPSTLAFKFNSYPVAERFYPAKIRVRDPDFNRGRRAWTTVAAVHQLIGRPAFQQRVSIVVFTIVFYKLGVLRTLGRAENERFALRPVERKPI